MSRPRARQDLSTGKLFVGTGASFLLAIFISANGVNVCTGIFALLTLVFGFLLYRRIADMIHSINWGTPRQSLPVTTSVAPTPPPAAPQPPTDPDSIFL